MIIIMIIYIICIGIGNIMRTHHMLQSEVPARLRAPHRAGRARARAAGADMDHGYGLAARVVLRKGDQWGQH